jgi:hypothetical protein
MIEEFKKSLANVDLGSNFGKQQTRLLNDMEKKAGEIGKTIG